MDIIVSDLSGTPVYNVVVIVPPMVQDLARIVAAANRHGYAAKCMEASTR